MLFRAIFAFGLVFILMPHEPNLGYGRPHMSGAANVGGWIAPARSGVCHDEQRLCISEDFLEDMRMFAVRSLGAVKMDIAESQRERLMRARGI
jgi:hypothetical protein